MGSGSTHTGPSMHVHGPNAVALGVRETGWCATWPTCIGVGQTGVSRSDWVGASLCAEQHVFLDAV